MSFSPSSLSLSLCRTEAKLSLTNESLDEAMRDWVTNLSTTHYLVGSAIGPAPFPTIVRDFQSVIGNEIKSQMSELTGRLPDAVVACVGGGSNAIGTFYPFIEDKEVKIVGVEAAGEGEKLFFFFLSRLRYVKEID